MHLLARQHITLLIAAVFLCFLMTLESKGAALEDLLIGNVWLWDDGNPPVEVRFNPNHKFRNPRGRTIFHLDVTGERTFTLRAGVGPSLGIAYYTFNADLTKFEGQTCKTKVHIVGTRLRPVDPSQPVLPDAGTISSAGKAAPISALKTKQSLLEVLKEQAPNAVEWALAPLDHSAPGDIRQNLIFLREDLLDEGKQSPKATTAAYALASQLCNTLLGTLEERNQALVRAGFRAVEAQARTGVTSQALEARRNYQMSWPQFERENAQRAELKSQATNSAAVMAERPKLEWTERTVALRKTLDSLYAQFREALRQPAAAK